MNELEKANLKAQLSTVKVQLILNDEQKDMFVDILGNIDFSICDNDLETLQLFFKRVYAGIEALKKQSKEHKDELAVCEKKLDDQQKLTLAFSKEIERLKSLITKEN